MTSYFDHNAHKTRRDKTQSATSWDVVDFMKQQFPTIDEERLRKWAQNIPPQTYGGKKAGER